MGYARWSLKVTIESWGPPGQEEVRRLPVGSLDFETVVDCDKVTVASQMEFEMMLRVVPLKTSVLRLFAEPAQPGKPAPFDPTSAESIVGSIERLLGNLAWVQRKGLRPKDATGMRAGIVKILERLHGKSTKERRNLGDERKEDAARGAVSEWLPLIVTYCKWHPAEPVGEQLVEADLALSILATYFLRLQSPSDAQAFFDWAQDCMWNHFTTCNK
eukprot:m51a1_g6053 hypothetical protein (216) ;mRNA; r:217531-220462